MLEYPTHINFSSISANCDFLLLLIGHGTASDAVTTQHTISIAADFMFNGSSGDEKGNTR
jgi:hypothetical protein